MKSIVYFALPFVLITACDKPLSDGVSCESECAIYSLNIADSLTGDPLEGTDVKIRQWHGQRNKLLAAGQTDSSGYLSIRIPQDVMIQHDVVSIWINKVGYPEEKLIPYGIGETIDSDVYYMFNIKMLEL